MWSMKNMAVLLWCLAIPVSLAIRIGDGDGDGSLLVDASNSSRALAKSWAPPGTVCCCKEVSKRTKDCSNTGAKLSKDPKKGRQYCCKFKAAWTSLSWTGGQCPPKIHSGYNRQHEDSFCPQPIPVEKEMLAVVKSNLAGSAPNKACIRASYLDSYFGGNKGLDDAYGKKSLFGNKCPSTAEKERTKFSVAGVNILCCRCPPGSIWNSMLKKCKCKAGTSKGQVVFPDAKYRICPEESQVLGDAGKQIELMREQCTIHRSLDEFLPPNVNQILRMGLSSAMALSLDNLQITDMNLQIKFAEAPDGATIGFVKGRPGREKTVTVTLSGLHIAVVVAGRRIPVTVPTATAVAELSGTDKVADILNFGTPNNINFEITSLQLDGSRLTTAVQGLLNTIGGLESLVKKAVLNDIVGGILTGIFNTIGMLATGADWPAQIKTIFDRRSPLPMMIILQSTPGVRCPAEMLCLGFGITSGKEEDVEELGSSELFEAGVEPQTITFNAHTTSTGDLEARLTVGVAYDLKKGLHQLSEWSFQSLFNEAMGIKQRVAQARKDLDGTMEYNMAHYQCNEPPKDAAKTVVSQAAGVGVSAAGYVASGALGAMKAGFWGLGIAWEETGGHLAAWMKSDKLPKEAGEERAQFEERIFRIWQLSNPNHVGFIFRSDGGKYGEPGFNIFSFKDILLNVEGTVSASERDDGTKGMDLMAALNIRNLQIKGLQYDGFNASNWFKMVKAKATSGDGEQPTDEEKAIWQHASTIGVEWFTKEGLDLIVDAVSVNIKSVALEGFATRSCVEVDEFAIRLAGSRAANILSKLPALLSSQIKNLVKTQIEGALGPLMEEVIKVAGDVLKTATVSIKLEPTGGSLSFDVASQWTELGAFQLKQGAVPPSASKADMQDEVEETEVDAQADAATTLGDGWKSLIDVLEKTQKQSRNPAIMQATEKLTYQPAHFLMGGAINNLLPVVTISATANMNDLTAEPVALSGTVNLALKQVLTPILNDNGALDKGHWLNAKGDEQMSRNRTILSCGYVYILPPDAGPEKSMLYQAKQHSGKWVKQIAVKDLRQRGACFETTTRGKAKESFCFSQHFTEVLQFEIQREKEIIPGMLASDKALQSGDLWAWTHAPPKTSPFSWSGDSEVPQNCPDHMHACETHLPCAGVGFTIGATKKGCYFMSVLDVQNRGLGASGAPRKCVRAPSGNICVGSLVLLRRREGSTKGVVYSVKRAMIKGQPTDIACMRDEFQMRAGSLVDAGCWEAAVLALAPGGENIEKALIKNWQVGLPATWGYEPTVSTGGASKGLKFS
eukprot:TRINITY_DN3165_c0_g1_i5.p1 TRINITY_DN3165_c0_g1~~TRINITY_DN3165_c0_g1_i5.p1  ORF type:complete len:1298 (-),score=286.58 TRINITY_DN3165_c0_g1_i5:244-4137(-)